MAADAQTSLRDETGEASGMPAMGRANHLAKGAAQRIEGLAVLDAPAKRLAAAYGRAVGAGDMKDTLSGTWMGHALHPALTDVVIGAWTSALVLDLTGGPSAAPGADRLLAGGLLASGATALTGLNDWSDSEYGNAPVRRTGLVHALLNVSAIALQSGSLAARRAGRRRRGVALSTAAVGAMSAGAWLGGHLTLAHGIGVDQTVFAGGPDDWTAAGPADAVGADGPATVEVAGAPILLVRTDAGLRAVNDRCSHRGCSLAGGRIDGGTVECPCHGSRFRLADGAVERGPATNPQPAYDVRERDGTIELRRRRA